jgi:hypothetical protein
MGLPAAVARSTAAKNSSGRLIFSRIRPIALVSGSVTK